MGPIPSVKPVNINEAGGPETSLLSTQNEQLRHKQMGNWVCPMQNCRLRGSSSLVPLQLCTHLRTSLSTNQEGAQMVLQRVPGNQVTRVLGWLWGYQPLTNQKNANTWQSASWVPKCGAVGCFRRRQVRQSKHLVTFLLEGAEQICPPNLQYQSMAPSPGQLPCNTPTAYMETTRPWQAPAVSW